MHAFTPNPSRINTPTLGGELSTILNDDGTLTTWMFTDSGVMQVENPELCPADVAELIVINSR